MFLHNGCSHYLNLIHGRSNDQMHTTQFHPARMAAVSINNIAVTLLSKGFAQEAMEILTNAVKLMKFVSGSPSTENEAVKNDIDWIKDLRQAQIYSSASMRSDRPTLHKRINPIWSQKPAHSLLHNNDFFERIPIPIYIEQITMEDGNEMAILFFECAIILYNLGLSHSLLAEDSGIGSVQCAVRESSLRIMEIAETVLANMYEHCHSSSDYIQETILFNMLLMRGLIQNKLELNQPSGEHCKVLSDLLTYLRHQQRLYPEANELKVASAA